jgi:LPXTG-motif cell wall-anchored protein
MRRGTQLAAVLSVLLLAIGALAMAGVATAQDGTTTDETTTDQTTDETNTDDETTTEEDFDESEQPEIPPGFTEDECDFTEREDGTTVVTCRHEREATFEAETARREVAVEPVGGTAAGAGGLAGEDGPVVPILIGLGGLALAGTAAVLARRRRVD